MVRVPCGQCGHCRRVHALGWAVRIMCEASMHADNSFLTLTYAEDPMGLCDRDIQLFYKRFRKLLFPTKIRHFTVGEYGDRHNRAHWHACVFGWHPCLQDQYEVRQGLVGSHTLDQAWSGFDKRFGYASVGCVTASSAAYCGQYSMKKITGKLAKEGWYLHPDTGEYCRPEHSLSSRGGRNKDEGGIGYRWFKKFGENVFPSDSVYFNGGLSIPPHYYMELLKKVNPSLAEEVASVRAKRFDQAEYDRLVWLGVAEKYDRSASLAMGGSRHKEF